MLCNSTSEIYILNRNTEAFGQSFEERVMSFDVCRYWAVALPAYLITTVAFGYTVLLALNMTTTPSLDSLNSITGVIMHSSILLLLV